MYYDHCLIVRACFALVTTLPKKAKMHSFSCIFILSSGFSFLLPKVYLFHSSFSKDLVKVSGFASLKVYFALALE